VLVATPGRLLDLVDEGAVALGCVQMFVLDEADRMLDMGFEKDIRAIAALLSPAGPSSRQTVMFSATWPPAIQRIASDYLSSPVKVTIGSGELAASSTVTQLVDVIMEPRVMAALRLSFGLALAAGAFNLFAGFIIAWVLVRYDFPGRRFVDALVDIPFALPTAVAGIALTAIYAPNGWIGAFCANRSACRNPASRTTRLASITPPPVPAPGATVPVGPRACGRRRPCSRP
jgi:ABC-type sugar transport system permease subunit